MRPGLFRITCATGMTCVAQSAITRAAYDCHGGPRARMTNKIALFLGTIVALLLIADYALADWTNTLFLARKMLILIEWMAFWR